MCKVIKRNGQKADFDESKIVVAIEKSMKFGSGIFKPELARKIANECRDEFYSKQEDISIAQIERFIFNKLITYKQKDTARAYEGYRSVQEFKRDTNTTDDSILTLINGTNSDVINENSNKNAYSASTQRDLIAGEVSKDIARRKMIPTDILQAHDQGIIHLHDMDYWIQPIFNCCLVNLKDMFANGTVINGTMVETPKSFRTACTVATQIMAQIASGQYGGQTISIAHLAPYLRYSKEKIERQTKQKFEEVGLTVSEEQFKKIVDSSLRDELKDGIQTMQYQINTLNTSNGQSPFVTIFMYINEEPEYATETAMIIEEIINQRYAGVKNRVGVPVTPAFPKLVYVLDDNNVEPNSEYYNLTKLAIKCVAKRMMPDFISAKIMKQNYDGNVFGPMGCRAFLSPWKDENGEYKWYGRWNMGVVSLNLPDVGLSANGNLKEFWSILENRLELCHKACVLRYEKLRGVKSDTSPIHWQFGGLARLEPGETIDRFLKGGYATVTLGYMGVHECVEALIGESITSENGHKLAIEIVQYMKDKVVQWKKEDNLGYALYGTPAESLVKKFTNSLKQRWGVIKGVTDRGYITNSFHVHVNEEIDAFTKLQLESEFHSISSGGCISYIEIPNILHNLDALESVVKYIYDNVQYGEINTKSDYCQVCGFDGEILIDENLEWVCPVCGNRDHAKMNVTRRTCGYLGSNFWNKSRTAEIKDRVLHL